MAILSLLRFLHVLAVVVWLGGLIALNIMQFRAGRDYPDAEYLKLLRRIDSYGQATIAPAAVVTTITGVLLVLRTHVGFTAPWVIWGLSGIGFSLLLGASLIRSTNTELRKLLANPPTAAAKRSRLQGKQAAFYSINILVLLSTMWAMEFRPTF